MFGFLSEKRVEFEQVAQSEDYEQLLAESDRSQDRTRRPRTTSRGPSWNTTFILVFCTAIFSAVFGALAAQYDRLDADSFSVRHTSQYCKCERRCERKLADALKAPILKDVGVSYNLVRFEGSLLKSNVFRQDAGPEVDAAWKSLGADCEYSHTDSLEYEINNSTSSCCKNPDRGSREVRTCERSSQDQGEIWWGLSSECRGAAPSTLFEPVAQVVGMELRIL